MKFVALLMTKISRQKVLKSGGMGNEVNPRRKRNIKGNGNERRILCIM